MYHPQMGMHPGAYDPAYAMQMPYQPGYPPPYGVGQQAPYPAAASGPVVGGVHVRYAGGQQQYWPAPGEDGQGQGW